MASCVQNIEKGPQINLRPSIVVTLHDAYTLSEGERSSEQSKGSHLDQENVFENEESECMPDRSLEEVQRHLQPYSGHRGSQTFIPSGPFMEHGTQ
jgi:hypothetical protein